MSGKTIAEVLMAKMKYEGEIEKFLREKVTEFTKETGVPIEDITVYCSSTEITTIGDEHRKWSFSLREVILELYWEGAVHAPVP